MYLGVKKTGVICGVEISRKDVRLFFIDLVLGKTGPVSDKYTVVSACDPSLFPGVSLLFSLEMILTGPLGRTV